MSSAPIVFTWDGDAMVPLKRFHNIANAEFVVGEFYRCEVLEERSIASHRHYFASLKQAWLNLPEDQGERFLTEEHLRKFALIKCGYADQRQQVCSSHAEALRFAAFVKPMDTYAVVTVDGCVVTVWTAQSQSLKAMKAKKFQKSKQDVLDYVAGLLGVEPDQLSANARTAA